jgi:hypothetical protein
LILHDLARPRPRIPIEGLGILPDQFLARLNRLFLAQLGTADDDEAFAAAMDRIERYGTAVIARDVEVMYSQRLQPPTCAVAVPALAYFFRADPAFATPEPTRVWTTLGDTDSPCAADPRNGLFLSIAERGMTEALQDAAVAALDSPGCRADRRRDRDAVDLWIRSG